MTDLSPKEQALLALVKEKAELHPFFFKKLKGIKWINPLIENGFFDPNKLPVPTEARQKGYVNVPFWPSAIYLASISGDLSEAGNEVIALTVRGLIRDITGYAKENGISNYKVWYQLAQSLTGLPHELLEQEDLEVINFWLNDPYERGLVAEQIGLKILVPMLEKGINVELAQSLIQVLFDVSYEEKVVGSQTIVEPHFNVRDRTIEKIAEEIGPLAGRTLGINAVKIFESMLINYLEKTKRDSWSAIWRSAIEDHEQNGPRNDADDVILSLYRDSLLAYADADSKGAANYIYELLNGKYVTLKRVAIFVCTHKYESFYEIEDAIIVDEFLNDKYRHEIWNYINSNYNNFKQEIKDKYLSFVDQIVVSSDEGETEDAPTAYRKAIWLSPVKSLSDDLSDSYRREVELAEAEPDHPDFSSYMSVGWVDYKSPVSVDELRELEVAQLINVLDGIEGGGGFKEDGRAGAIKALKEVVKADPSKIMKDIGQFLYTDLAYSHQIIEAFRDLWNEKSSLAWDDIWERLLDYCHTLVNQEAFWSEDNAKQQGNFTPNRHWLVSSIGQLIEDGVRSDDNAFDLSLMEPSLEILTFLLNKQEGEEFDISHDSVITAINSPRGRLLEAAINHALRSMRTCQTLGKEKGDIWKKYEGLFESELKKSKAGEFEFVTLIVNYLPNFLYMSKEWTMDNLPNVFNKEIYQAWVSAFNGYAYVGTVYQEVYEYLRDQGHFAAALDDKNLKNQVYEKIIQNAVIAFVNDFEGLDDEGGLLNLLIQRNQREELQQIIWFTWTLRDKENEKLKSKVIEMWSRLIDQINYDSDDGVLVASDLCDWTVFVDDLSGDEFKWIREIAPYAEVNHNSHDLLKMIARLSQDYPYQTQQIWLKLLAQYSYDYPEESIREALGNYLRLDTDQSHEGTRLAKAIADAYLIHGLDRPSEWLGELKNEQKAIH